MELPHLGKNCALGDCNRLDFLPVKCDACSQVFCVSHYNYDKHNCQSAKNRDNQVPVCPICSQPVASKPGQLPDVAVSEHIDRYCKANEAIKNKIDKAHTNLQACEHKSCKQKDVIYLECGDCRHKFCIKHRSPDDHGCSGPSRLNNLAGNWHSFKDSCSENASSSFEMIKNKAQGISRSGQAALNRLTNSRAAQSQSSSSFANGASSGNLSALQGGVSEEEALRRALRESGSTSAASPAPNQQEAEDLALARAIQQSELEANRRRVENNGNKNDNCIIG